MDPQKLNLSEQGRRYDHYMELKEWAMTGLEVIERSKLTTEGDRRTKAKLEAFVEVLDRRIRYLADWDNKIFSVASQIREAGIHRPALLTTGVTNDQQPKAISQSNPNEAESNQTDLGDVTTT